MVNQVVINVLSDNSGRSITIEDVKEEKKENKKEAKKKESASDGENAEKKPRKPRAKKEKPLLCPVCGKGSILRGKTAYGCSEYKNGCNFRMNYDTYGEGLSDAELAKIIKNIRVDKGTN